MNEKRKFKLLISSMVTIISVLTILIMHITGYDPHVITTNNSPLHYEYDNIPKIKYSGNPYVELNNNVPYFINEKLPTTPFQDYVDLDNLGRVGAATACLGPETLPTEKRGPIGMIKPAGWHTIKYPGIIKDLYLYNRCHLIAFELSGQNANEKNLTTGTRYLNISGMLPFENKTRKYIDDTGHHVLYRVTPLFLDNELVCRGVIMEAKSVEDNNLQFCVYCFNVQPGIVIDYKTGNSHAK